MNRYQNHKKLISNYSSQDLVNLFEKFNEEVHLLDNYASLDVLPVNKLIRHYDSLVKEILKSKEQKKSHPEMVICKNNIQEIVTHLQVHDIISQKLEHIHFIHTGVIHDVCSVEDESDIAKSRFLSVLPEIVSMNRQQLQVINTEYGTAIRGIQKGLMDTECRIRPFSSTRVHLSEYFFHLMLFEKCIKKTTMDMMKMTLQLGSFSLLGIDKVEKMNDIAAIFTMESERLVMYKILYGEEMAHFGTMGAKKSDVDQTEFF